MLALLQEEQTDGDQQYRPGNNQVLQLQGLAAHTLLRKTREVGDYQCRENGLPQDDFELNEIPYLQPPGKVGRKNALLSGVEQGQYSHGKDEENDGDQEKVYGTEQAYRHHADHVVLAPGAKVCKCVDEIIRAEGCQHDSGNKHDYRNGADKNAQYAEEGFHFTVPMDLN